MGLKAYTMTRIKGVKVLKSGLILDWALSWALGAAL